MRMTLTLAGHSPDCHSWVQSCRALAASERAAAKRRKPAGYSWPLWHEARKPVVEKIETVGEVRARHARWKPKSGTEVGSGPVLSLYTWPLWHEKGKRTRVQRKVWPAWPATRGEDAQEEGSECD